jgi:hypothetical protein
VNCSILYIEYQTIPSSELGPPTSTPPSGCVSPLDLKGGGATQLAGEGIGGPNSDDYIN